jgi:hypothetical protein
MKWQPPSEEELERRGVVPARVRKDDGTFQADDPATPDVNEACAPKPAKPEKATKPKKAKE